MPQTTQFFPVERTIDYTVRQRFLVLASDPDQAGELVERFAEETDWSVEAGKALGVFRVSDDMEQMENTCEVVPAQAPISGAAANVDESLAKLTVENSAQTMLALLRKIAMTPAIYCAGTSALGMEVKALVDGLDLQISSPHDAVAAAAGR